MHENPRILIVEDDASIRRLVAKELEGTGWGSEPAKTATEALDRVERGGIALVILDLKLEVEGDGLELVPLIRGVDPEIRFVFLTGGGPVENYPQIPLVRKPHDARDLIGKVKFELYQRCQRLKNEETHATVQRLEKMLKAHIDDCTIQHKKTLGDMLKAEGANPVVWYLFTALLALAAWVGGSYWKASK